MILRRRAAMADSFLRRSDVGYRQIPMSQQDLEPALFLALVLRLIRPELLDEPRFAGV